jgi:hypothetical protein
VDISVRASVPAFTEKSGFNPQPVGAVSAE